jgi:membrane protein YqaA with SNARE-associated domain
VGVNAIAALWGFAEATLFFIVPDVWLTVIAVWSLRKASMVCLFALLGALTGGALMYGWGYMAPGMALTTLERIPGIHPDMLLAVAAALREYGLLAPFWGPIHGIPDKIYAVQAPALGIGCGAFAGQHPRASAALRPAYPDGWPPLPHAARTVDAAAANCLFGEYLGRVLYVVFCIDAPLNQTILASSLTQILSPGGGEGDQGGRPCPVTH